MEKTDLLRGPQVDFEKSKTFLCFQLRGKPRTTEVPSYTVGKVANLSPRMAARSLPTNLRRSITHTLDFLKNWSRACGFCALLLAAAGCSTETRDYYLRVLLDGVDKPPPERKVRRDYIGEIQELKRQLAEAQKAAKDRKEGRGAPPIEQAKSWEKAKDLLPQNSSGGIDWVKALKDATVAPRSGIEGGTPAQAVLDLPVELQYSESKSFRVTYEHEAHTQWLSCKNCHPTIFPLGRKAAPVKITMAKINAGEACGACHGAVAFGAEGQCTRCHRNIPAKSDWNPPEQVKKPIEKAKSWQEATKALPVTDGMVDWVKALAQGVIAPRAGVDPKAKDEAVLPLDVERVPAAGEMFKVVFSHKSHTEWLACPNCHTGIFQMAKGSSAMSMEKINSGEFCGVCHGKVAFAATACARCHPAMGGGK